MSENCNETILIVDDELATARLHQRRLERAGYRIAIGQTIDEANQILDRSDISLAVLDYKLSGAVTGLDYFIQLKQSGRNLPVILVTGFGQQEMIIDALRAGVRDFVVKTNGYLDYLPAAVGRVLRQVATERKLAVAEDRLLTQSALIDKATNAVLMLSPDDHIQLWNNGAKQLYGWSESEAYGKPIEDILPVHALNDEARRTVQETGFWSGELRNRSKDGREIIVESRWSLLRDNEGRRKALLVIDTDVTVTRVLEGQLRQSQKMEAIGRLAGGVAHDFNNLLTVILGYSDMLLEQAPTEDRELVGEIRAAADRATVLTRQLLAFSRKQMLEPKVHDLNVIVADMQKMLRRLIDEDIAIHMKLGHDLANVCVDRGQIEQVILNLAVNARDVMPHGGDLSIETENVELDEEYCKIHAEVPPGPYVMLAVSDSGMGMDEATKCRIFEPFFTTKDPGSGTGLGLATVYGVVKQSSGHIWVYTEQGCGTTFKVYLPATRSQIETRSPNANDRPACRGDETILVVEDDSGVRSLTRHALKSFGYHVLEASSPVEAIEISKTYPHRIDLLLADVILPQIHGPRLAELLCAERPEMQVIFVSGYTDDAIGRQGILNRSATFMQKPFKPAALTALIRQVLDRKPELPDVDTANDAHASGDVCDSGGSPACDVVNAVEDRSEEPTDLAASAH